MDILEPVIQLNIRTQGHSREKCHDFELILKRLETIKAVEGPLEKQLLEQVDFTEEYPKLNLKQGPIQLRKLPGHITQGTRSQAIDSDNDIINRNSLICYVDNFKQLACDKMQDKLKGCMNQDSIANAFGVLNILSLPVVYDSTECF